jgi:hypothetical protein
MNTLSATAQTTSPPPSIHQERPGRHAVAANDTRTTTIRSKSPTR